MRPGVHNDSVARQVRHSYASCCSRCAEDMTYDAAYRFMRDVICGCDGAQRFFLLHHTLHDGRPQVSWNTIVRLFRPRSSARKREEGSYFEIVHLPPEGVAPSDTVFQTGQGRGRKLATEHSTPSVPSDSFQLAPQQVSYGDNGFDLSITSFPLVCLSPDGSRLCPSVAESTPSVPLFSLALSLSKTVHTSSGALSRSNTASLVQETLSFQLDIRSPFLLNQSLLNVPFLIGCTK
jgi:hypothetical protein